MKYDELTSELFNSYILSNALVWSGRLPERQIGQASYNRTLETFSCSVTYAL